MFAALVGVTVRVEGMSVGLSQLHRGRGMGGWGEAGVVSPIPLLPGSLQLVV